MKIGIITLNGFDNYGNVLQNYAVQEIVKEIGAEAETIRNTTIYGHYKTQNKKVRKLNPSYIKKYVHSQLNYRYNIKNTGKGIMTVLSFYKKNKECINRIKARRKMAFEEFVNSHIRMAKFDIDINQIPDSELLSYDYFISGSDQVWNPVYPSTSMINFLQFAPKKKRIAYAPSFGVSEIPDEEKEQYKIWLEEIPFLSVREEQGKKIIKELTSRNAVVLADPTMSVSREEWISIERRPKFLEDEQYILTYFLGNRNKEYENYIHTIEEECKLKIINLYDIMDMEAYSVSPQEFIYLIRHAKMVCTDSFHGMVFSIIFHSNFIVFPRIEFGKSMESRVDTLLSKFELQERDYRKVTKARLFSTNFDHVDDILLEQKESAINFLKDAIGVEINEKETASRKSIYEMKKDCCGCSACVVACPKECIKMQRDVEGFTYPVIDETKCIHCNKCHNVCPMAKEKLSSEYEDEYYAAYSKNARVRYQSSSGGIFTELAEKVIDNKGVVFGAGFDINLEVKHLCITSKEELHKLQGSKYVQSDIGCSYSEAKDFLEEGRLVYFSGTPCQIKGFYTYLGKKNYPNLITQDIICHGVPSPKVWKKYIEAHEKSGNIKKISFRDKKYGWHYFSMAIEKEGKVYRKRLDEDWYMRLFLDNTILRPICYECPMKKEGSCADITLADCWNPTTVTSIKDDDRGLSLVNIHSTRGKDIWEELLVSGQVVTEKLDNNTALKSQSAIEKSASMNPRRHMFFEALQKEQFNKLQKTWYRDNLISKMRKKYIFYKTKLYRLLLTLKEKIKG